MIEGSPPPNVPDWLNVNLLPSRPKEREPWYYGFLEKYARVLLGCSVLMFVGFALMVLFPEIAVALFHFARHAMEGSHMAAATEAVPAIAVRLLVATVVIGFAYLLFLLPTLLTVAYILVAVDVGRTLRDPAARLEPVTC